MVGLEGLAKSCAVDSNACSCCASLDHPRLAPGQLAGVRRRNCVSDATADFWLVSVRWSRHRPDTCSWRIGNSRNLTDVVLGRRRNLRRLLDILRVDDRFHGYGMTALPPIPAIPLTPNLRHSWHLAESKNGHSLELRDALS